MSPAESPRTSRATGPRTPEGKRKSSHNALRHGLTGRVVVMPWEDMDAWRAFCDELMADLAPRTLAEKQWAQTICDTQWRLNRVRSLEEGLFVLDRLEGRPEINLGHPEVNAAVMAARTFRDNTKAFANLTLYEQRLNRVLKEAWDRLRELQAELVPAVRAAAQAAATEEFVFANDQSPAHADPAAPPHRGASTRACRAETHLGACLTVEHYVGPDTTDRNDNGKRES